MSAEGCGKREVAGQDESTKDGKVRDRDSRAINLLVFGLIVHI